MNRFKKPSVWMPAIAFLVYFVTLFCFPAFVRDNGEIFRFLTQGKMYRVGDLTYGFDTGFAMLEGMPFSAAKLLFTGLFFLWYELLGIEVFDIRILSLVYVALSVFGLWLIGRNLNLRTPLSNGIAGILVLLSAVSYGFFSYYNTFYIEGAAMPLLLMALGAMLEFVRRKNIWSALLFVLFAAAFTTLGPIAALMALFFVFVCIRLVLLPIGWKRILLIAAVPILMVSSTVGLFSRTEPQYRQDLYNSFFFGTLAFAETPQTVTDEIGLPQELADFANKPYFEVVDDLNPDSFYPDFDYGRLAGYYANHPKQFWPVLKQVGNNVYETSISYLRSFDERFSFQRVVSAPTRLLELVQLRFLPRGVPIWLIYIALMVLLCIVRRKDLLCDEDKALTDCFAALSVMPTLLLVATAFLFGLAEISKQLFYTNLIFGVFFVAFVSYAAEFIILRRNRLRDEYGVNQ